MVLGWCCHVGMGFSPTRYMMYLQGDTPQAKAIAKALLDKQNELAEAMTAAIAKKVCLV